MDYKDAVSILNESIKLAAKRGAFNLEEIEIILQAMKALKVKKKEPEPVVEENKVEEQNVS